MDNKDKHSNNKANDIKEKNYLDKPNNDPLLNIYDDLTSSASTTITNNNTNTNTTNTYFYPTYKTPKKDVLLTQQNENKPINQISLQNTSIPSKTIYSKGKIKRTLGNINNIIINNNTNIINNNNANIINNNYKHNNTFDNNNNDDKELINSFSQINLEKINEFNNKNQNLGNIVREKPVIMNKKKINQKYYIHTKNNNNNNNIFNHNFNYEKNSVDNKKNINNNNDYKNKENDLMKNINKNQNEDNNAILNVEELLMIEEKLSSLIKCLSDCNPCTEECFECFNFYFTTKFSQNFNKYFINDNYFQLIKKIIILILFSYILCYDICLNENIFQQYIIDLKDLFNCVHIIIILISKYFSNRIVENNSNIYVKKLQNLIQSYDPKKKSTNIIFEEINYYYNITNNIYPFLLEKYNKRKLNELYNNIYHLHQNELYKFFFDNIFINKNINGSIITSSTYFEKNKNATNGFIPAPYLKNKSNKPYTLVLDLDETLIHFKYNPNDESSGTLQFRPFLSDFLSNVKNFFELVVFTAATQDYADPIIDAIENKGTTFDYRLYRDHTINNNFLKDLSRLGRDMSRIIIVDNMEQNYKLQPDNGITIRPFWGKDTNDMALFDLLYILIKIVKNNMDVRDGIKFFKEDIISKVTSNIFRRVQY
jgi:Dullard-like phosphatase family protein